MNHESEAIISLLNSRNIRLVTAEIGDGRQDLERTTLLTGGSFFSGTSTNYGSTVEKLFCATKTAGVTLTELEVLGISVVACLSS